MTCGAAARSPDLATARLVVSNIHKRTAAPRLVHALVRLLLVRAVFTNTIAKAEAADLPMAVRTGKGHSVCPQMGRVTQFDAAAAIIGMVPKLNPIGVEVRSEDPLRIEATIVLIEDGAFKSWGIACQLVTVNPGATSRSSRPRCGQWDSFWSLWR